MQTAEHTSGNTLSLWLDKHSSRQVQYPSLTQNETTDVCIIGAGIAGLTTAYRLLSQGKRVVVLESGLVGSGETGRTTAHLSNAFDDHYVNIIKAHGLEKAKLLAESHTAAIDYIAEIVTQEQIDCDFCWVDGYLFAESVKDMRLLEQEFAAAKQVGLTHVELLADAPADTFQMGPCLKFPKQAQFHPLNYLVQLAAKIVAKGGVIYELSHVDEIQPGDPAVVKTIDGNRVTATAVVQATNVPINDKLVIHMKQSPQRTYVVTGLIPKGSLKTALYWDTAEPYHYVRLQAFDERHDALIIGGEDHRVGFSPHEPFTQLKNWAKHYFPRIIAFPYEWSGQVLEPTDHLAFIGANPGDAGKSYIVTGDSGNGMTHGTIAGLLLTDLIMGQPNPWAALYDPQRKSLAMIKGLIQHNLEAAIAYTSYVTPGDIADVDAIPAGSAAIIRQGLKKLACYRALDGKLHQCSAVCPHLNGLLRWNPIEKTWDCPAHGSRFTVNGEVLNGPAVHALAVIRKDE